MAVASETKDVSVCHKSADRDAEDSEPNLVVYNPNTNPEDDEQSMSADTTLVTQWEKSGLSPVVWRSMRMRFRRCAVAQYSVRTCSLVPGPSH